MEYPRGQFSEKEPAQNEILENFCKRFFEAGSEGKDFKRISLEQLQELKERGVTTENFLDSLCQKYGVLLHGSINEIKDGELKSDKNKIFATNKPAIAIMRSIYSNIGVNLEYPYLLNEDNPLVLKIHTPQGGEIMSKERGFVYIINNREGFTNNPIGSWQFIKESGKIDFNAVVETEKSDFKYPIEIYKDLE